MKAGANANSLRPIILFAIIFVGFGLWELGALIGLYAIDGRLYAAAALALVAYGISWRVLGSLKETGWARNPELQVGVLFMVLWVILPAIGFLVVPMLRK